MPRVGGALSHAIVSIRNSFGAVKPASDGPTSRDDVGTLLELMAKDLEGKAKRLIVRPKSAAIGCSQLISRSPTYGRSKGDLLSYLQ